MWAMTPATLTLTIKGISAGPAGALAAAIPRPDSRGPASTTTLHLFPMPQHTKQGSLEHLSVGVIPNTMGMSPEPCLSC